VYENGIQFVKPFQFDEAKNIDNDSTTWWYGIAYGAGKFVAVGGPNGKYSTSTNGINWTTSTISGQTSYWYGIYYAQNHFIIFGRNALYSTSTDGTTWSTPTRIPTTYDTPYWWSIVYAQNKFVIVGTGGYYSVATSIDQNGLMDWRTGTQLNGTVNTLYAITYAQDKFVVIGQTRYYTTSTDAETWSPLSQVGLGSGSSGGYVQDLTLNGILYAQNKFIIVGANNTYSTSTDGTTWTALAKVNPSQSEILYKIVYVQDKFIACGENGLYAISTNGTDWTTATISGQTSTWRGIAYSDDKLVFVGLYDKYATSGLGTNNSIQLADNIQMLKDFNITYEIGSGISFSLKDNPDKYINIPWNIA
jgi:hypothetical protein